MTENCHKNEVLLTGRVLTAPEYSHCNHENRFYKFQMELLRLSGQRDVLVVIVGEELLEEMPVQAGKRLTVLGQLRSYNNRTGAGSKLVLTVFAQTLGCAEPQDENVILLTGALCKKPMRRNTPLGREICDIMLAVNRTYGRSDYIPCIAWGALAGEISEMQVGDTLSFQGRIQSRIYHKLTAQGMEQRVAYEVSVMNLE